MKKLSAVISKDGPRERDVLWIKPVEGGFELYALYNGKWQPLKVGESKAADTEGAIQELVGSVQDKKSANTINGAKAFAKDAADALKGKKGDSSSDLTLNGLKKYIDEKVAELG